MRGVDRGSRLYARLRGARNAATIAAKRLRGVDRTTFVHRSAQVAPDLAAEEYVFVGPGCRLGPGVEIGRYAMLAAGVSVVGDDHEWRTPGVPVQFGGRPAARTTRIGRDAWLGDGATVMAGVTIGEGAIVAARAVVTKDVPPYEVWGGVPARRLDVRFSDEDRQRHAAALDGPLLAPSFAGPKLAPSAASPAPSREGPAHLCVLTTAHPLDDVRVATKIAGSFLAAGWRVSWVGPDHSFFAGEGHRIPGVDYELTPAPRGRRDRLASASRVARAARRVHDVDWWYSPDPDAAAVAVDVARRQGGRVVFDVHEEFHGAMLDRWTFGHALPPLRELVRRRVARIARACDLVVGVDDAVLAPYVDERTPSLTVRNCAPRGFARSARNVRSADPSQQPLFVHGKALPGNGTPVVLDALARVPDVRVLLFPGRGAADGPRYLPGLDDLIAAQGVGDRVVLHDAVSHDTMPEVLAGADVGLIAYGRALGEASLPNRIFEYMAAGLAVLVPTYAREMVPIVEGEAIGLTCDFEDPEDVARAMRRLRDDPDETVRMGERAREAFLARHNWDVEFGRLLDAMT